MTSGDETSYTISIAESKDDHETTVGCPLAEGEPPAMKQGDAIEARGKVSDVFGARR